MSADQVLQTLILRVVDGDLRQVPLAVWPAPEAADNYARTTPLIAANGVADLYGALEDIVFELYKTFLSHNPQSLMEGDDFHELRRLWREHGADAAADAAWKTAWKERFDNWRRKRAYDGLDTVLAAFYQHARLRRPRSYRLTDVEDWARTIKMIAELRHLIVHGAAIMSDGLANLSGTPTSLTFEFVAGEQLAVCLHHLQSVECFYDQLLTAINLSLVERAL